MVEEGKRVPIVMVLIDGLADYQIKWPNTDGAQETTL